MADNAITFSSSHIVELTHLILGLTIQALLNGGILILGVACISLFSLNSPGSSMGKTSISSIFWRLYIIGLIALNLTTLTTWWFLISTFLHRQTPELAKGKVVLSIACNTTLFSSIVLTDGVLVWRCYMVQNALGPYHGRLKSVSWILPLLTYVATLATGVAGIAIAFTAPAHSFPAVYAVLILGLNSFLNIYATSFIAFRLFRHHRLVKACPGTDNPIQHQRMIRILLESAAINVPITLTTAIGRAGSQAFSFVLLGIGVGCQSFATILILHQVALRKAIGYETRSAHEGPEPRRVPSSASVT